jgi:predicted Ser/Thr protein kinase
MALNLQTETAFSGDAPAAKPPLPPEQIAPLFPQLEILACLGRGGMGVVYQARQKTLNRLVALKILAPERVHDAKFAERFTREAQALAALNHPNIVTIHDFGQTGGFYYLLMEYVDGANLRQLMQARKFTPEEALAIVPTLCDALQFAHEHGIVHRDIKPENILLDKSGRVKVADFGIAKMLGSANGEKDAPTTAPANVTKSVVGTPGYSAPEQQLSPERVDSRADIYSLGVVFYEMLTGELPGKPIEPPSHKVQIDVRLDEVVLRALEKKPERRYQQASVLKTQLETIATEKAHSAAAGVGAGPFRSGMVRIVEILFGITFSSPLAVRLLNLSALGFLGSLAFLGYVPLPGMQHCFGFSGLYGLFGLIGFAFIVEMGQRKKNRPLEKGGAAPPARGRETAIVGFAAILFVVLMAMCLSFALEFPRQAAAPLIVMGICVIGLVVCGLSFAGLWPFASRLFPQPNFSSRNLSGTSAWRTFLSCLLVVLGVAALALIGVYAHSCLNQQSHASHPATAGFSIDRSSFPHGDSLEITSVEQIRDQTTVRGHYHLVSTNQAMLGFYITTSQNTSGPDDPRQTLDISQGSGDFELVHPHIFRRFHLAMYSGGHPFGSLDFTVDPVAAGSAAAAPAVDQIQDAFGDMASLHEMAEGRQYELAANGEKILADGDSFLRRRTGAEILASGLSSGCGDYAVAFIDLMSQRGFQTLLVDSAEISLISLQDHFSGHAVVAVRDAANERWLLADPTNKRIITNNWDVATKTFYNDRFWIGYCGPLEKYSVHSPEELKDFYARTLAAVPPEFWNRHIFKLNFRTDPSLIGPDGKLLAPNVPNLAESQSAALAQFNLHPETTVDVLLDKGNDDGSSKLAWSADRGWVCTVGLQSACSVNLLNYLETRLAEAPAERVHRQQIKPTPNQERNL